MRDSAGAGEPRGVRLGIDGRDARDRHAAPVLARALRALRVCDRLAILRGVDDLRRGLHHDGPHAIDAPQLEVAVELYRLRAASAGPALLDLRGGKAIEERDVLVVRRLVACDQVALG